MGAPLEKTRSIGLFGICLLASIVCFLPWKAHGEEIIDRKGFVFGGWLGYGSLNLGTDNGYGNTSDTLAFGLKGGYAIMPRVVLGLELNGWTLEEGDVNDPSEGESISNVSLFLNFFPLKTLPFYIEGGGGRVSYTNNSPGPGGREHGGSWFVGCGYEYPISKRWFLAPHARYAEGDFTDGKFHVIEMALGLSWYSGTASK